MHTLLRSALAGLLALTVVQAPVLAAPGSPVSPSLGVVVQATHAAVGDSVAAGGSTVFDGDRLDTDARGSLRATFGGSQASLLPSSAMVMHSLAGGIGADLLAGTVVLSSVQGSTFRIVADGATIRPKTAQPAIAQVTVVSPRELVLMSRGGELEVSAEGESKSIPAGSSYRMVIEPADPGAPPQGPAGAGSNRNKVLFFIIAGAVAATAVTLVLALESPSKPQ